jgi:hypothetical protein
VLPGATVLINLHTLTPLLTTVKQMLSDYHPCFADEKVEEQKRYRSLPKVTLLGSGRAGISNQVF